MGASRADARAEDSNSSHWWHGASSITVVKATVGGVDTFEFTSSTLTPSSFTLTTTSEGEAGSDSHAACGSIDWAYGEPVNGGSPITRSVAPESCM